MPWRCPTHGPIHPDDVHDLTPDSPHGRETHCGQALTFHLTEDPMTTTASTTEPAETQPTIGDSIAVQALMRRTQEPNAALVLYAQYLDASLCELLAAKGKPTIEQQLRWSLAQSHAVVAYLLWALHDSDQGAASDAAWEITEMCEAGEPMADWVTEHLTALGVDVDAVITAMTTAAEPTGSPA